MKVVSASMAKNIADDFENNALAPVINEIMNNILKAAQRAEHSCNVRIPFDKISYTAANTTITFFKSLGYKISDSGTNGGLYYTLYW